MENDVTDRVWDKDVQDFIEACKNAKLGSIVLGYSTIDDGRKILNVTAQYHPLRGEPVPVGYRWTDTRGPGWLPEVFVRAKTAAATAQSSAFRRLAWRAGLWRERKRLADALLALKDIFFKAQLVRSWLDQEHLKTMNSDAASIAKAQELTLQTLNDLAYLYSGHPNPLVTQRP